MGTPLSCEYMPYNHMDPLGSSLLLSVYQDECFQGLLVFRIPTRILYRCEELHTFIVPLSR